MLPAVKVFAVAALLGGGAVGTFALAGGFGPKGNGSGNGKATAQVAAPEAAKPASSVPGVAPTAPTPAVGTAGESEGGGAVDVGVQQREEVVGGDVQAQEPTGPQTNTVDSGSENQRVASSGKDELGNVVQNSAPSVQQSEPQGTKDAGSEAISGDQGRPTGSKASDSVESQSQTLDNGPSGEQEVAGGGKDVGETDGSNTSGQEGTPGTLPSESSPGASTTDTQRTGEAGLNTGNTAGGVGSTGTKGEETRTASGGEGAGSA